MPADAIGNDRAPELRSALAVDDATVHLGGSFTWQRNINRTAWIYFMWIDTGTMKPTEVRSNVIFHKQPLLT